MRFKLFGENSEQMEINNTDYMEVNVVGSEDGSIVTKGKIGIVVERLNEFSDTDRILKSIRNGNIIFLKIKGLKEKDIGELKRSIERLKKTIIANNGDIAGVEQDWLILTPRDIIVQR